MSFHIRCLLIELLIGVLVFANTVFGDTNTQKESKYIGEEPEEIEEIFLRKEKVLLEKGQPEIEIGFLYIENPIAYTPASNQKDGYTFQTGKVRRLITSLTARYGITDSLLTYITVPFRATYNEISAERKSKTYNNTGLGDIRWGLNYQIMYEGLHKPDLMLTLAVKSISGEDPYETSPKKAPLGTGHYNISAGAKVVKTVDPVVLFCGLDYTYVFKRDITDYEVKQDIKPGDSINCELGTGFALNDKISMTFRTTGSYISRTNINSKDYGSISTPVLFSFNLVGMVGRSKFINPSVGFGITNDASDLVLGISYIQQF